jgi:hypothetical protein
MPNTAVTRVLWLQPVWKTSQRYGLSKVGIEQVSE